MSDFQKNFKWSDGTKNLDIKRIQLCNATSILHWCMCTKWSNPFTDTFRMLTRVAQVPLNIRDNSLSLVDGKYPKDKSHKSTFDLLISNFHTRDNYILQLDTEFKLSKTPFLKFPHPVKWNKKRCGRKKESYS